jgi:hypothetical protein
VSRLHALIRSVTFVELRAFSRSIGHEGLVLVGDKSPKANDKAKKQQTADKNQKKAAANEKAAKQGANANVKKK